MTCMQTLLKILPPLLEVTCLYANHTSPSCCHVVLVRFLGPTPITFFFKTLETGLRVNTAYKLLDELVASCTLSC